MFDNMIFDMMRFSDKVNSLPESVQTALLIGAIIFGISSFFITRHLENIINSAI